MRDPNRIPAVLARIELLWKEYPDMRLGQLIANLGRKKNGETDIGYLFNLEDDKLSERAADVLVKGKWPPHDPTHTGRDWRNAMKIYLLFNEPDDGMMPWLTDAIDEYSVEECDFPEEYAKKRKDPRNRELIVEIPDKAVEALFRTPILKGCVVSGTEPERLEVKP